MIRLRRCGWCPAGEAVRMVSILTADTAWIFAAGLVDVTEFQLSLGVSSSAKSRGQSGRNKNPSGDLEDMNIPGVHIERIRGLGYTESEARFLYIVARRVCRS